MQNFNKTNGLSNPCIFWTRGQRIRISQDVLTFRTSQDMMCLFSWGGGLCIYVWVGGIIRWRTYQHHFALLSHRWSLWHLVFTVLASVENWELYLGSQCCYWPCGNGTPRKPCESQIRKMLWVYRTITTTEACALCYKGGVSKMPCTGQECLAGLQAVFHSETRGAGTGVLRLVLRKGTGT